jgi:hypothetical protein
MRLILDTRSGEQSGICCAKLNGLCGGTRLLGSARFPLNVLKKKRSGFAFDRCLDRISAETGVF